MRFDFGRNWEEFSRRALTPNHAAQARADFAALFDGVELAGRSFFDIGFGQGLSLLSAAALGARTVGCDVDPLCPRVLHRNAALFPEVAVDEVPLIVGSIMDEGTQARIRALAGSGFDVVHAWGVLHHTGDMWRAIRIAAGLVAPRGHLVIAIYNRHWTSPTWRRIKWLYCRLPGAAGRLMVAALYPVIWTAKLAVTRQNPHQQQRGMDFYHDVVDWVGGYPYEFSAPDPVRVRIEALGFELLRLRPPRVPTGRHECVARKAKA